MNKTFKKALAAFLAVLMVVFSVPFTALAADPVDTGAKIHVYAVPYDGKGAFLGLNNQASDNHEVKFYDLTKMSVEEVKADAGYSRDKDTAMFALVFSVEGTNIDRFSWIADYDGTAIKPAYWRTNAAINKDGDGTTYAAKASENLYVDGMLDVMGTTSKFEEDGIAKSAMYLSVVDSAHDCAATTDLTDDNNTGDVIGTIQGELCAVLGFELLKDCDLSQVIKTRMTSDVTLVDIGGKVDAVYGGVDWRSGNPTTGYFTIPELGLAPAGAPTPTTETYTYTFADGSQTTVDANVGEAPVNPANTADTAFANVAGTTTHTKTTYSWVADGDKAFKEVGTPVTEDCDMQEVANSAVEAGHLTDGKKADTKCSVCGNTVTGETITAEGHQYVKTTVAPTCVDKGYDEYVCSVCNDTYKDNYVDATGVHTWVQTGSSDATCQVPGTVDYECSVCKQTKTETGALGEHTWREDAEIPATCTTPGVAAGKTCTVCGAKEGYGEIAVIEHTWKADAEVPATCTTPGVAAGKTCTVCGAKEGYGEIAVIDHTWKEDAEVPATCTTPGVAAGKTCTVCGATEGYGEIAVIDHTWREDAEVPATCTTPGVAAGKTCTACGATEGYGEIAVIDHTWREDAEVPATRAEAGVAAGKTCTVCDEKEGYEVIPALGVDITVAASSLGTAAVNGETVANATKNVAWASSYTLTATANENAKFLGWKVGNKIVSDEPTYTTNAYADMTYTPVFVEADAAAFTVTFVDSYGNVTATVESSELPLAELPTAPSYAGLNFTGWDLSLEEVNALTNSATVTAKYENDTVTTYEVTAPDGCTIIVDGKEVASPATVTYNTLVTVKKDGVNAWTANGAAAGFGSEYTFYCGSDITVAPAEEAITAQPVVAAVSADKTDTHKVTFLATRSVPEGFQLVESGFVYGKAMAAADLVLENVGKTAGSANGTVKQVVCNNKGVDGQFSLSYGVKAMDATASAAAYLIYKDGGQSVVIYAPMIFDYSTNGLI